MNYEIMWNVLKDSIEQDKQDYLNEIIQKKDKGFAVTLWDRLEETSRLLDRIKYIEQLNKT